jgi:hypothetical protein
LDLAGKWLSTLPQANSSLSCAHVRVPAARFLHHVIYCCRRLSHTHCHHPPHTAGAAGATLGAAGVMPGQQIQVPLPDPAAAAAAAAIPATAPAPAPPAYAPPPATAPGYTAPPQSSAPPPAPASAPADLYGFLVASRLEQYHAAVSSATPLTWCRLQQQQQQQQQPLTCYRLALLLLL